MLGAGGEVSSAFEGTSFNFSEPLGIDGADGWQRAHLSWKI